MAKLGVEAENMGTPTLDPGIVATAQAAEQMGVDSISVSDHLLTFGEGEVWLEAMMSLAAISSVTNRAKLIAAVVVLPQRNVLEFLQMMYTLDAMSAGRFALGVGVGGGRRSMEALGYFYHTRGNRTDEMLQVFTGTKNGVVSAFAGEFIQIPEGIVLTPHPEVGREIPIFIGGLSTSMVSCERAVRHGAGWMDYSMAGNINEETVTGSLRYLHESRDRDGLPRLDTIYKLGVIGVDDPHMFEDLRRLMDYGFDEIIVQGIWNSGIEAGVDAIGRIQEILRD